MAVDRSLLGTVTSMAKSPDCVNRGSRSALQRRLLFTIALLGPLLVGQVAEADRVVVLRPAGELGEDGLDALEDGLAEAIRELGHQPVTESSALEADTQALPETANEMRAIADMQSAQWVVTARALPQPGGMQLTVRVAYAAVGRVEELDAEVRTSNQAARLRAILEVMLRPEGLGADVEGLAGDDAEARAAEDGAADSEEQARLAAEAEAERLEQEAEEARLAAEEEAARADFEERERLRAAEAERRSWNDRERYGVPGGWMVLGGLAVRPLFVDAPGTGGVLGAFELTAGRSFRRLPGFQLRGSFDIGFGSVSSVALHAGGVYLASPFANIPLHFGGGASVGVFRATTGNNVSSLLVRFGPIVAYRPTGNFFVEVQPDFTWLSANNGATTIGVVARAGLRFE